MEYQVGDELDQKEVGEILIKSKTVVSYTVPPVSHVEVSIAISRIQNLCHSRSECEEVEDDQVYFHHPVALLDLLVLFQQDAN
jgi:hypothetical protein